jgi:hypothetical protein
VGRMTVFLILSGIVTAVLLTNELTELFRKK